MKNITIPSLVTSIGEVAFQLCSGLETVAIGERVETIMDYAFSSCSSLVCIYFYVETSPTVSSNAFSGVQVSIMTLEAYKNETFGNLNVSKGTTIDGSIPILTFTSELNIFTNSNTFTESNAFAESNTFTELSNY